jgi:hypothetical protein
LEGVYIVVAGRKEAPAEKAHMQYGVWPLDDTNSTHSTVLVLINNSQEIE